MTQSRRLPRLEKIVLSNFTLFQNNARASVDFGSGVFCLAGANGMGKSSFLAAVNFGLTGVVANPNQAFRTVNHYYEGSLGYSKSFFDGRVSEVDRDIATITLEFTVGSHRYSLTRSLFEPQALRELSIFSVAGRSLLLHSGDIEPETLHDIYTQRLVKDCHLANFAQYVFLQHFLLTFDERRHLLFWDSTVTDSALYLAFGLEADDANRADELRSLIDKAESNARNAQWQSKVARNRLATLAGGLSPPDNLAELTERYEYLSEKAKATTEDVEAATRAREDAVLSLAQASAHVQSIRQDYDQAFTRKFQSSHDALHHPLVLDAVRDGHCGICGNENASIAIRVSARSEAMECPLCGSEIGLSDAEVSGEDLQGLDRLLIDTHEALVEAESKFRRRESELTEKDAAMKQAVNALEAFQTTNQTALHFIVNPAAPIVAQQAALRSEQSDAVARRDEYRAKRDDYKEQLLPLQAKLTEFYRDAELEFVPKFRNLARSFIGLELDVFLERNNLSGFQLGLTVEGTRRRATSQLSESQRFFLDIALRMALAQQMSDSSSPAPLLIDTPEGSLDISYEARAGTMFADFVKAGHQLVMTANINTSQLLLRLAKECGSHQMTLVRMTDWAPLSEVQASEEDLFDRAYSAIERELIAGDLQP